MALLPAVSRLRSGNYPVYPAHQGHHVPDFPACAEKFNQDGQDEAAAGRVALSICGRQGRVFGRTIRSV